MSVLLVQGDARQIPLKDASVACCVTSPPYFGLRDYGTGQWVGGDAWCTHRRALGGTHNNGRDRAASGGMFHDSATITPALGVPYTGTCPRCGAVRVDAQIGLEQTHDCLAWARQEPPCAACWVCAMRAVFAEVHRVLAPTGTLFVNVGDAYASSGTSGHQRLDELGIRLGTGGGKKHTSQLCGRAPTPPGLKPKSLLGLPWRLALALQADGFILRAELIWHKLNPMPESVLDRPTRAHEQVFLFSKQGRYYYDGEAVREPYSGPMYAGHDTGTLRNLDRGDRGQRCGMSHPNGRAMRSVLSLASEPLSMSHFATFPTALVRRCLLAGAPQQVCRACSKPWVRQVERTFIKLANRTNGRKALRPGADMADINSYNAMGYNHVETLGFSPTCHCGAPGNGKAVVLDPFAGSGTTLLVARELGHHGVGLDLSYPYLATIARERLGLAALTRWTEGAAPRGETHADLPLFAPRDPPVCSTATL